VTRPAVPEWASDSVFTAGAGVAPGAVGQPVRVEPTSGRKGQGDSPGLGYDAETHNWIVGLLADNAAWVQGLIDSGGDFNYPTGKNRKKAYPLNHGWNPFSAGDWYAYNGQSIRSQVNEACWVVPLVGIPEGAQVVGVNVRVKTHNATGGRTTPARMEIVRYSFNRLLDLSNPLTYDSGPNPGWEIYTGSFSPPGPFVLDFPAINLELFAGTSQPFFIEGGYEYAVRLWAGIDGGAHNVDEFYGVAVDWVDFGPRSGG